MQKNIIAIRQMGETLCWTLVHQAMGIPDVKMVSDFMENRVGLLLFAKNSLPERLCATAAIRQMGGTTIYVDNSDPREWQSQESRFQHHLLPIFGYYFDCLYLYGINLNFEEIEHDNFDFPVINAGGGSSHPINALADIACMLKLSKQKKEIISTGWIGDANGTLYSLVEASAWFPFSIKIFMPDDTGRQTIETRAQELNAPVKFVKTPEEAARDCSFIYAGKRDEGDKQKITPELFHGALPDARLLLSASPIRAITVEESLFNDGKMCLTLQAQYRLAIHKRLLHWLFSN